MEQLVTIISLNKAGVSSRSIAKQLKISRTTVLKYLSEYEEKGDKIYHENNYKREFAAKPFKKEW